VLKTLPDDQQDIIASWCSQGTLESAVSRCLSELGIKTNIDSMSKFHRAHVAKKELQEHFAIAESFATSVEEMLRNQFPDATPEKIAAAGQLVFTMKAANSGDSKEFRELEYLRVSKDTLAANIRNNEAKVKQKERQLTQKDRDLQLAERRVALLEENAAKAKAQLEGLKTKGGLTPETLAAIEQAAAML
jgi:hypothetical protein